MLVNGKLGQSFSQCSLVNLSYCRSTTEREKDILSFCLSLTTQERQQLLRDRLVQTRWMLLMSDLL